MKKTDLTPEIAKKLSDEFREHAETLRSLYLAATERALHYLLFINSGAAIAMLTFMGQNKDVINDGQMWLALGAFVAGIVFLGCVHTLSYFNREIDFRCWIADIRRFWKGEIDHDQPEENLDARARKASVSFVPVVLGLLSWFAFMAGVVLAVHSMYARAQAAESITYEQTHTTRQGISIGSSSVTSVVGVSVSSASSSQSNASGQAVSK